METERFIAEFERARIQILRCLTWSEGGKKAEQVYSRAYQKLVSLGLKPQIKRKYRAK